jgi:aerotolerance regulator-like protein
VSFLHPWALVGLAAAAIPAVLHLLHRRTPPELDFPAVRYLSDAERRSARRLRLRHLLLLLLRTALLVTIVLAAARPLVPTRGPGGGGSVHAPTALVVILDNSPSAGAVVDGRPTLDRLKAAARAVLARAAATDRCWLLLADGVMRAGTREALRATVDSLGVSPRRLDLVAAVANAARLVDAEPLPAREVYVVSDLQQTSLGPGRAAVPRGVRVTALAAAAAATPNHGVAELHADDGAAAVTVGGTPGTPAAPLTARLRGRDIGRALASPGAALSLPLPAVAPGWWVGEIELAADELRADDRRFFVWRVAPPAHAAADPAAGPFVAAALAVLRDGGRVGQGGATDVSFGDRVTPGARGSVVLPPDDPALLGPANRALAARGVGWRFAGPGTPGPLVSAVLPMISGVAVARRYRLESTAGEADSVAVIATVNGEPWLVHAGSTLLIGSRLDTAWTALPAGPGFVPFVDALANRIARGEAGVTAAEGAPRVEFTVRGADTVAATVYGPDPRESDLTPADAAVAARVLGAAVLPDAEFAAEAFAGTRRADVSGLLLLLALLLAGAELAVASLTH